MFFFIRCCNKCIIFLVLLWNWRFVLMPLQPLFWKGAVNELLFLAVLLCHICLDLCCKWIFILSFGAVNSLSALWTVVAIHLRTSFVVLWFLAEFYPFTEFDGALNAQWLQLASCCSRFLRSLLHRWRE
jgi:hypothetical protein